MTELSAPTASRNYHAGWRFTSLRVINSGTGHGSHSPVGYDEGHTSGLRLLLPSRRGRVPGTSGLGAGPSRPNQPPS